MAAGSGGLLIADSSQAAAERYKELYEARVRQSFKPHLAGKAGYNTPFRTIEDAIAGGPQLIGSPSRSSTRFWAGTRSTATTSSRSPWTASG